MEQQHSMMQEGVNRRAAQVLNARYSLVVTFDDRGEKKQRVVNAEPMDVWNLNRYMTPLTRYRREWHITKLELFEVQESRRPWTPELKAMYDREMLRLKVGEIESGTMPHFEVYLGAMEQLSAGRADA